MTQTNQQKQSYLMPFIIMVVLMSLVGLITSLNQQFQAPMQAAYLLMGGAYTNTFTTLLVFAFFLAYLVIGPVSSGYIERNGYKKTLTFGLVMLIAAFGIYELSAYVFNTVDLTNFQASIDEAKAITAAGSVDAMREMAASTGNFEVLTTKSGDFNKLNYLGETTLPVAYWVFLCAAFVAGTALTFLQAVINPYIVACDVPGTSGVQRQNISGTGNSTMTTIGPFIVTYLIFNKKSGLDVDISSLYLPITILMALVALLVLFVQRANLPSIAGTAKRSDEVLPESVLSFRHLTLGIIGLFMYVGVEVCVGANINLFALDLGYSISEAAQLAMLYWGGMLLGRFLASAFSKISAQTQLTVASIGASLLILAAMVTGNPWTLVGVGLFHSVMWPAVFSMAIEGLGRYTSKGTGLLLMGIVGGAVMPLIQGWLADYLGAWTWTWAIVILGEAYLLYYALIGSKVLKRDQA